MVKALIIEDRPKLSNHVDLAFKLGFPEVKLSSISNCDDIVAMVKRESPEILILGNKGFKTNIPVLLKQLVAQDDKPLVIVTRENGEIQTIYDLKNDTDEICIEECSRDRLLDKIKIAVSENNYKRRN